MDIKFPTAAKPWHHPNPLMISDSSMGLLEYCKRKFEFTKLYELPRDNEDNKGHMAVGHAMHKGWQTWMVTKDQDAAVWEMMKAHPLTVITQADDVKSLEACYTTLKTAMNSISMMEYQIAEIKCIDGVVRPAVEVEFEIWLEGVYILGRPVVFIGFIDVILYNLITEVFTVVDVKSLDFHKRNLNFIGEYLFKSQTLAYGLVLQHISQKSLLDFNVIYLAMIIDLVDPEVKPIQLNKNARDVQDWYTGLYFKMKELKEFSERDWFPRREGGCNSWGRPCYYMGVCQSRNKAEIQQYFMSALEAKQPAKKRNPWLRLVLKMPEDIVG